MGEIKLNPDAQLNHAVKIFVKKIEQNRGYRLINNNISFNDFLRNKMLIVHAIKEGISYDFFNLIKEKTPFNDDDWARFLGISSKSLQRNKIKEDFIFKPLQSEKILELAEVTVLGTEVFDNEQQFYLWLTIPNAALNNMQPMQLLCDSYGKEMVINELHKIDYGIFL
jgi:putative toxin-antitoxin system antitoxin component (TIGR02293 family)